MRILPLVLAQTRAQTDAGGRDDARASRFRFRLRLRRLDFGTETDGCYRRLVTSRKRKLRTLYAIDCDEWERADDGALLLGEQAFLDACDAFQYVFTLSQGGNSRGLVLDGGKAQKMLLRSLTYLGVASLSNAYYREDGFHEQIA